MYDPVNVDMRAVFFFVSGQSQWLYACGGSMAKHRKVPVSLSFASLGEFSFTKTRKRQVFWQEIKSIANAHAACRLPDIKKGAALTARCGMVYYRGMTLLRALARISLISLTVDSHFGQRLPLSLVMRRQSFGRVINC